MLPKGNLIQSGVPNVLVTNTCAFDSILHAIIFGYTELPFGASFISKLTSKFAKLVETIVNKDYLMNVYAQRTDILKQHCESTVQGEITAVDCTPSLAFVLNGVLGGKLCSGKFTKKCSTCKKTAVRLCQYTLLNESIQSNITNLQESAALMITDDSLHPSAISKCCSSTQTTCRRH